MIKFFGITGIIMIILGFFTLFGASSAIQETVAIIGVGIGFMNLGFSVVISILDEIFEKLSENKDKKN